MEGPGRPVSALVAGAACISFAPILVKVLLLQGVGPSAAGFWRCALGAVVLAALAIARGRSVALPRRAAWAAAAAGLVFFVDLAVWHRAIRDAGAGLATILGNMQVFLTALLAAWLFRERIGARFAVASVVAVLGVTLLVGVGSDLDVGPDHVRGVGYGLVTALAYACFLLCMRLAGTHAGEGRTLAIMTWMTVAAAVPLGLSALAEDGRAVPAGLSGWAAAAGLAIVAQSIGWWSISRALPRVPGAIAGLVLLLQPVLATVWGVTLLGETLTALQVVGAILTLGAIHAGSRRGTGERG